MTIFEMVKYHSQEYPSEIPLATEEIAAHFDISNIRSSLNKSLHTEYSYGKRKFNSSVIASCPELISANKDGVPQLWKSETWAEQFAHFIIKLNGNTSTPELIEIHPPFNDYTDIARFITDYRVFETLILAEYPNVQILIENRCGSIYHGGKFLISKIDSLKELCEHIEANKLKLRIAFDAPQIYTAHNANDIEKQISILNETEAIREHIAGVHLWGKSISASGRKVSHCGDLNSYFNNDANAKHLFLQSFANCFNDGIARKMVLEVNSGNADLLSIISDLKTVGIVFE